MKSREVNRIVEILPEAGGEGEDLGSEDSALLQQSEVYLEDEELEGPGNPWEDCEEEEVPAPAPAPALAPAPAPLRRSNRRK
jgi:hypothetical protein